MGREQEWLVPAIAIAIAAVVCAAALSLYTGYPSRPGSLTGLKLAALVMAVTALARLLAYIWQMWRAGETHPSRRILRKLPEAVLALTHIAAGILTITVFLHAITFLKSMIPAVVPFWADAPFAAIDKALLLDPEALAVSVKPALSAMGVFYGLWHGVNLAGIIWVLHWRKPDKGQFIISYMLTWSLGMALAFVFSSAGPIFVGLYDAAIAPASVQKAAAFLWANYESQGARLGGGISAFPSMHVAVATWFALALGARGQKAIGPLYVLGVSICSVVLGWHYSADAVGGVAVALAAHQLSRRWRPQYEDLAPFPAAPIATQS